MTDDQFSFPSHTPRISSSMCCKKTAEAVQALIIWQNPTERYILRFAESDSTEKQSCLVLCLHRCHYSQLPSSRSYRGMKMDSNFPTDLGALTCEVKVIACKQAEFHTFHQAHDWRFQFQRVCSSSLIMWAPLRWTTNHTKNHRCIPGLFQHIQQKKNIQKTPPFRCSHEFFKKMHLTTSSPIKPKGNENESRLRPQLKVPAMSPRHCIAAMGAPKRKAEKQVKGGRFSAWENWDDGHFSFHCYPSISSRY